MQTPPINPERVDQEMQEAEPVPRRSFFQRLGCWFGVLAWLIVMLIPAALFILAVQGEIALWHGGRVPESEAHPLLQVRLIMEIDTRGLMITSSMPTQQTDDQLCMQTDVRYVLWAGQGENSRYCDCYQRAGDAWQWLQTDSGSCGG